MRYVVILIVVLALAGCSNVDIQEQTTSRIINPEVLVAGEGPNFWNYAYNNQVPGPLFTGLVGETINVTVYNNLSQPTTVHWHGLRVSNQYDGVPDVTQVPIQPQESFSYQLKLEDAGLFWYHPHVNTPEQLERGLFGTILVTDPNDPIKADQEEILVLDDVRIQGGEIGPFVQGVTYYAMHGRFGNELLMNGKSQETIEAPKNGLLRLRIVNVANARTFYFAIEDHPLLVLGRDIGLGEYATEQPYISVSPGQRYDILIYLNQTEGTYDLLSLSSRGHTRMGSLTYKESVQDRSKDYEQYKQMKLAEYPSWEANEPNITMQLYGEMRNGKLAWTINGKTYPEQPELTELEDGKYYQLRFQNMQGQIHPMHLHGQRFVVLARNGVKNEIKQWQDTVLVGSRETVDLGFIAHNGTWVQHCHILEHAEVGMLGILEITK